MSKTCFHCAEDIPPNVNESLEWNGQQRDFCCIGCRSVSQAIIDNGLDDYYKFRTDVSVKPDNLVPEELSQLEILDDETIQQPFVTVKDNLLTAELGIDGITCAACSWIIETQLGKEKGVERVSVNPVTHRLSITWDKSTTQLSKLIKSLVKIGYNAYPFQQSTLELNTRKENRRYLMRLGVAGLGMMQVMMYALGIYIGDGDDLTQTQAHFLHIVSGIVATPIVFFSGFPFFRNAFYGIKAKKLVMDVPVVIAISIAYVASVIATITNSGVVYFDSVSMFIFFLLTGRFLEHRVRTKAIMATQSQRQSLPFSVTLLEDDKAVTVPLNKIKQGNRIRVKPGDTVPVDGIITDGESNFDESLLTGEPLPVKHGIGDKLLAGCVNESQSIVLETTATGEATYLAALQSMTMAAADARPELRKITDTVAHWFVLSILIIVTLVYLSWLTIDPDKAFWVALSVLVVSCPCALSLATPTALTTASMKLKSIGMLLLNNNAINSMSRVTRVAFDKTGTLTSGRLNLDKIELTPSSAYQYSERDIIDMLAYIEQGQNHPIARAIQRACTKEKKLTASISHIKQHPGKGVEARVNNRRLRFGSLSFCQEELAESSAIFQIEKERYSQGIVDLYLIIGDTWLATILLSDKVKPESRSVINSLSAMGKKTAILSGDLSNRAAELAQELRIDQAFGELKPEQKAQKISQYQADNEVVMMVGDGLNDTVVLAQADIGIAVDTASDITRLNADAVLTSLSLDAIPQALELANKTERVIKQNLIWALGYNLTAIPFAAMGMVPPWLAAIGMTMSSVIVVLNALRLNAK